MLKFLRFNVLGIDISDFSIEVISLRRGVGKPRVSAYGRIKLPPGIVKNGKILKPTPLIENIEKLLKNAKPQPIKDRLCLLSLPESQIFTHVFRLPAGFDKDKIRKSILYEIERIIPLSLQESYFDFIITQKDKETQEIFYAATYKSLVHQYIEVLREAGLIPVAFDLESASLARALIKKTIIEKNHGTLLVDIGARTTNVGVFVNENISGSLTIPIAGDFFTKKISKGLNVSLEQAEDLKKKAGFDPNKRGGQILEILTREFEPIVDEIKKYIRYSEEQSLMKIRKIVLAGGSALMPKILSYFQSQFDQKVEITCFYK